MAKHQITHATPRAVTEPLVILSDDTATITVGYGRKPGLKGAGRGLGTYGLRLPSERFLSGRVEFQSHPTAGTTFTVTLPCDGPGR